MKKRLRSSFLLLLLAPALLLSACNKETAPPAAPAGATLTTLRSGTVVAQGGVSSGGTVAIVKNGSGDECVKFNANFHTDFHTGALGIYLAKSNDLIRNQRAANPGSVFRVDTITQSGAQLLPISGASSAGFSHVILHCDPAQYNFGAAALQ